MLYSKTVFILAPHPDDAEIACGGTIARLVEHNAAVYFLVFGKDDTRKAELRASLKFMGIKKAFCFDVPIREFLRFRQQILDKMVLMKRQLKPDLVIMPSLDDIHQDHQVIAKEGLRAFKDINLLGYEASWNNMNFEAQMFIRIDNTHLETKIRAMGFYKSQSDKPYMAPEYVRSLARVRGVQAGFRYAEMFNVVRQVVR